MLVHLSASFTVLHGGVSQEWQARRAQGAVALTTLQALLGQLEQAAVLPGTAKFWQRITTQVQHILHVIEHQHIFCTCCELARLHR